jgi:chorismate synthase
MSGAAPTLRNIVGGFCVMHGAPAVGRHKRTISMFLTLARARRSSPCVVPAWVCVCETLLVEW